MNTPNWTEDQKLKPLPARLQALPTLLRGAWRNTGRHGTVPLRWRLHFVAGKALALILGRSPN